MSGRRNRPNRAARTREGARCSPPPPPLLPPTALIPRLSTLTPYSATAALVCRRLRAVCCAAAALWESVELRLPLAHPRGLERTEAFLAFLIPRAGAVHRLTIVAERTAGGAAEGGASGPPPPGSAAHVSLVWSNLVSALTLIGAAQQSRAGLWDAGGGQRPGRYQAAVF